MKKLIITVAVAVVFLAGYSLPVFSAEQPAEKEVKKEKTVGNEEASEQTGREVKEHTGTPAEHAGQPAEEKKTEAKAPESEATKETKTEKAEAKTVKKEEKTEKKEEKKAEEVK